MSPRAMPSFRTTVLFLVVVLAASSTVVLAGSLSPLVKGKPTGFAAGTIGGGNVAPSYPQTRDELAKLLKDSQPRVIVLTKEFDFRGFNGAKVTANGCRPDSNKCPNKGGQDAIDPPFHWCSSKYPRVNVTYDPAALTALQVTGSKTIIGQGANAAIRGKGLRVTGSNVIVQNIHIYDLNPQYIWGGDAFTIAQGDQIWFDHNKISMIGRQFIVTGYSPAGRVTISNNELNGLTQWSASCDGRHYWTMLFLGSNDKITLAYNQIHHTSGRSPKVAGSDGKNFPKVQMHAIGNFWQSLSGHAFDVHDGAKILVEGNVFETVAYPHTPETLAGSLVVPMANTVGVTAKAAPLRRNLVVNKLDGSPRPIDTGASSTASVGAVNAVLPVDYVSPAAIPIEQVKAYVLKNAGVGKI
ncbi:hypothetical protein AMAG_07084 [Allomyces macrogynus ATCC 38327]|uniref:pectin lyase n=1 Tax=Allomyces macrogynus (strain ATCC 38327) TaxID=578462 RepID=A0A0L0SH79_ALLM3|nr:hypothetical protein AMAG_07084 [Allomyces macrogynus ATCC 38327]|eukprot:KNE61804.1 hypothetical protein AMAG_07084 [Allomyces macrogynus ATCC 38327]